MALFQRSSVTARDRYPSVFAYCAEYARRHAWPAPRLLSLGCSTGEELATLRQHMPGAEIWGLDISPRCIRACARTIQDPAVHVVCGDLMDAPDLLPPIRFDMIFCLTVFLRSQLAGRIQWFDVFVAGASGRAQIGDVFSFHEFESALARVDALLAVNGLLVIVNSSYMFHDTSLARRYEAVTDPRVRLSGHWWKYDRNGRRVDYRPLGRLLARVARTSFDRTVHALLRPVATRRAERWVTNRVPRWSFYRFCVFRKLRPSDA